MEQQKKSNHLAQNGRPLMMGFLSALLVEKGSSHLSCRHEGEGRGLLSQLTQSQQQQKRLTFKPQVQFL